MTERNDTDETNDTDGTDERERTTMRDVDHTHPYDDTSAGELFLRGPTVAADGGERNAVSPSSSERSSDGGGDPPEAREDVDEDEPDRTTMKDVDHSPPDDEGANRAFERGEEHATEPVVGEE
jgi:hypothetical protein